MTDRLIGKRAVVTGAASGIGLATAIRFAEEGAKVALLDIDPDRVLVALESRIPTGQGLALQCDVGDETSVRSCIADAVSQFGGLDVVVANAGIQLHDLDAPVHELDLTTWERTMAVNLTGVFLTCKYGVPPLLDNGTGSVIITGSPTGLRGSARRYTAYSSSKAGLYGLMRVMANQYGEYGVRVNCVVPGYTDTPLVSGQVPNDRVAEIISRTPLRRQGKPEDVAAVMTFLASDESEFVSGAIYPCDGGSLAV